MTLSELKLKLEQMAGGLSTLVLDASAVDSAALKQLLAEVPTRQLTIGKPVISDVADNAFTVSGEYADPWPVVGIPPQFFALDKLLLTLSEAKGTAAVACRLTGTLGASRLPVEVTMSPEGGWQIGLLLDTEQLPTLEALAALTFDGVGMEGLAPLLENEAFQVVTVNRFQVRFDAHRTAPTYIDLHVWLNRPWHLVPDILTVEKGCNAEFYGMHTPITDELALTSIGGVINGVIALGQQAYAITISLNDTEAWAIEIKPDNGFPELADLAFLAGGAELRRLVHDSLNAWGFSGLTISGIAVGFDPTAKIITYVSVNGRLEVAQTALDISVWLPEFGLSGRLVKDHPLQLGQLLKQFAVPGGYLPDLTVADLFLAADPKNGTYALEVLLDEPLHFAPVPGVPAMTMQHVALHLAVDPGGRHSGSLSGIYTVAGVGVELTGTLDEVFELSGTIEQLRLIDLITALSDEVALPDELPDVEFSQLQFSLTPATGALALSGRADGRWHFPSAESGLVVTGVDFALERTVAEATATTACKFTLHGNEATNVAEGLTIKAFALTFTLDRSHEWSLAGEVRAALFDADINLQASYAQSSGTQVVRFAADTGKSLQVLDLAGIAHLGIAAMTVEIGRTTAGATTFDLAAKGRIMVEHAFDFTGMLHLFHQSDGATGLAFKPDRAVAEISLPLDIPGHAQPLIYLEIGDFTIRRDSSPSGTGTHWVFAAAADAQLRNIPSVVQHVFPAEKLSGSFYADGRNTALRMDWPSTLQPQFPELALKFSNGYQLSLGKPGLNVRNIELHLGAEPELVEQLRVTLPERLNDLFGKRPDGTSNQGLFNPSFDLSLSIGRRLRLQPLTSPLKPLAFYEKAGDDGLWTDWDFGPVGRISFRVPEFAYDVGRWQASGGVQRLTDLALPLTPFKFLLEQSGFPRALTAPIPDALPLKDTDLTGDNFAREMKLLLGDQVLGRLDKNLSALLNELFDAIKTAIDHLPSRLQEFLQIRIPKSAIFEISVDAVGGGTTLGLRTLPGDPPLRFLFPTMSLVPELVGFSLRGLAVGQKLGGALLQIESDGHIDRFDLISLIAALALDRRDMSNHYILEKTLVLMPTGLPLPIPLFFSHLGLDYRDLLGFNIQAHWSYPDPKLGVFENLALFTDLLQFFKNPDYLLHKEGFAETLGLELTIGENFITLPEYLGGQTIGLRKSLPTLSIGDSVARFLDFLKTGNAGYAITAIPLRYQDSWIRIGSEQVRFGPLALAMSWCITTEEEFVNIVLPASKQHGNLPLSFDEAVLDSLPKESGTDAYQKGFILLLMGKVDLGNILGLRTEFGMAVTARGGFETGFRISGEIGRTLALTIGGKIQAAEKSLAVEGDTGLYWNDQALVTAAGHIAVSDTALETAITIELTPFFAVAGLLIIGKQGLLMQGEVNWGHGAEGPDQGLSAMVAFSREGMSIGFAMRLVGFDAQVMVRVPGDGEHGLFTAAVVIKPDMTMQESFSRGLKSLAKSVAESSVDQIYNDLQQAIEAVHSLEISVAGLAGWLPPLCDRIIASVTDTINDNTTGWKLPARGSAHDQAKPSIKRLSTLRDVAKNSSDKNFRAKLKTALQDIVNHNRLNITIGVPAVRMERDRWGIPYPVGYTRKATVYNRDMMDAKQLAELRRAIDWIDALPDREGRKIETQAIYDQLPDRDKLLARINLEVTQGIDGVLPQIESISFGTALELLHLSDLEVTVSYRRSGEQYTAKTTLDLTAPVKSTQQLIDAFGNG